MDESSQSSSARSSSLKNKFIFNLICSLRGTQSPQQPRFLRMLGFSEHEVETQISDKYRNIHELVPLWGKTVGFTSESIEIPRSVRDEMLNKTRNNNIDHVLLEPGLKSFRLHRDRAWLMYKFIGQFTDVTTWDDFARNKLEVEQRDIRQIKIDIPSSWEEQQFRILLDWVKREKLGSSKAIYEKLKTIADVTFPQPTSEESFSDLNSDDNAANQLQKNNAGTSEERKLQEPGTSGQIIYHITGNTFHGAQVASSNPVMHTINQLQANDGRASEERKLQERDAKLRKQLKKAISSQFPPPQNLVPVQIIKYEKEVREESGSGFDEKHRMPRETQSAPMTSYDEKQLFDEAHKVGGNFVGVVGEPGIGKTSLVKVLMEHVSSGDSGDDRYFFYVPFKGMNFKKEMTVFEFLVKYLLPTWKFDPKQDKDLLEKLSDSNNVYIFTDALDEADDELFSSDPEPIGLYDRATADVIVKNLFSGHLLSNAKKLVTSRPDAFLNLHKKCKPKFNVNMLGLGIESQEQLSLQICDNDKQKFLKVQEILKSASDLSALCRVPFYCQMIVKHLLNHSGTNRSQRVTSTILFTEVLRGYVKIDDYLRGKISTVLELTKLAQSGVKNNQFIFKVGDLNVNQERLKNFVISKTHSDLQESILPGEKRFYFVHVLWQEYFAALHLMFFADMREFRDFLCTVGGDRWNAVIKFVFGCLDGAVKSGINDIFCDSIKQDLITGKREVINEYGTAVLKRVSNGV